MSFMSNIQYSFKWKENDQHENASQYSVVTHFPNWGQWAQFSSIQYLHTTDVDMGGGILFCIVFIVHIFQTCFNNDTLFYFFHLKVQSLIVWQRNPTRIDWRGPSPVFRLTMRPPPGSSVRVMETKHHLDPGTRRRSSPCSQTSSPRPRPPSHRPPPHPQPPPSCRCACPRAASTWPGPSRTQRRWAPASVCEVVT